MTRTERATLKRGLFLAVAGVLVLNGSGRADLVPGGGPAKSDCYAEVNARGVANPGATGNQVKNNKVVTCTDGEACDQGACGDNACTFSVALCINQKDPSGTCTPPASLDSVKVKAKGTVKLNVAVPQLLSGSGCGAFVDGTLTVPLKPNGKPKKVPQTKLSIVAEAPKGTKPRSDNDQIVFKCLPRTTPCPVTSTTTTTSSTLMTGSLPGTTSTSSTVFESTSTSMSTIPSSTSTTGSTTPPSSTTTTTQPQGFSTLAFTTIPGTANCGGAGLNPVASAPFSGALFTNTGATTPVTGGNLGLACLYIGGGAATTVAPLKIPDSATSMLQISGNTLSASAGTGPGNCTLGYAATKHCISEVHTGMACTSDLNCEPAAPGSCAPDPQCFFGPPLPLPNGALSTCVLNPIASNVTGTADPTTGSAMVNLPLGSRTYLTGNSTSPCPKCVNNACVGGARNTLPCTPVGAAQTSLDCPPTPAQFVATLGVSINPLTTGVVTATSSTGSFCPSQANVGAFGKTTARAIREMGVAPGNITDGLVHNAHLAAVFCIPKTGNLAIDGAADLPGPGAIGLNVNLKLQ
jgi:hypothetical protein